MSPHAHAHVHLHSASIYATPSKTFVEHVRFERTPAILLHISQMH